MRKPKRKIIVDKKVTTEERVRRLVKKFKKEELARLLVGKESLHAEETAQLQINHARELVAVNGVVEMIAHTRDGLVEENKELRQKLTQTEQHVKELRHEINVAWDQCDWLRNEIAGMQVIRNGMTVRDARREIVKFESMQKVPGDKTD